jgi:flavin reductase (DIM6/NTAB) family NADH-FMN oxidoreductase RutF
MRPNLSLIETAAPGSPSADEFGDALSALASGVVVVTCRVDGRPWGMTVTAFASVSADPPTVLVSLASSSPAARAIAATGSFAVSILAAEQVALARSCARAGAAKFLDSTADAARGALAHLECTVSETAAVADHTVFFGRVDAARTASGGSPLVYHRRAYRRLATTDRSPA